VDKALASETILAYEVNGAALPAVHGAPLRAIVPGYIGARSVKWLGHIKLEREPSPSHHQRRAYRMLQHGGPSDAAWDTSPAIDGVCVTSAICSPLDGSVVAERPVRLRGYAVASEGASITEVAVSADAGASWQTASLAATPSVWAWRLWKATLDLSPGVHTLTVCATDSTGATQPSDLSSVWNARGYMNNAWHRITIRVA
jgi:sulfite oxidase